MKAFLKKHELPAVIALIVLYVVISSWSMNSFGMSDPRHFIVHLLLAAVLAFGIVKLGLSSYCGLTSFPPVKKYLYFLPLLLLLSVNLWNGINITQSPAAIVFYMLAMFCIGFIEEIIFRGFLFKMMAKNNVKSAVIVSSLTFGFGHIVNLLNGADIVETAMQILYAVAIGFLFVIIFIKSGSLWPCIITHSIFNALSVFNVENTLSLYIAPIFLLIIPLAYSAYLIKKA